MGGESDQAETETRYHRTENNHFPTAKPVKKKAKERLGQGSRKTQNHGQQTGRSKGDLELVNQKRQEWRKKGRIKVGNEVAQSQVSCFTEKWLSHFLAHDFYNYLFLGKKKEESLEEGTIRFEHLK
jgi:hypothetical protein